MQHFLENDSLQFELHPDQACWGLHSRLASDLDLQGVCMAAVYQCGGSTWRSLENWANCQISASEEPASPHGLLHQLHLSTAPDACGVHFTLDFAMPQEHPLFLWRLTLHNNGTRPALPGRLTLLQVGPACGGFSGSRLTHHTAYSTPLAFFSNGWGSWNYTGAYDADHKFRRTRLGPLTEPMRINAGTPQPTDRGHFSSDMFGVLGDRARRAALLAGFLSQNQHFGSLEAWLRSSSPALCLWANGDAARLDPGQSITTDWACLHFVDVDIPDPLGPYLDAVVREVGIHKRQAPGVKCQVAANGDPQPALIDPQSAISNQQSSVPTGWCSWYHFFDKVTTEDVRRNLHAAVEMRENLPLDVFQIDDGFQVRVGDWLAFRPSFSEGIKALADDIHAAGLTPGLWLAPFIVDPRSRLAAEHPDWLLRGRFNRPANAGFGWDTLTTALDMTHPEALEYTSHVVHTAVHEWGFPYLKLDFLYAAALPGRRTDPTRTRAQVLRAALQAVRQAAGDEAFLVGCGCPLGPALGLVDAMRIGADVAPNWIPRYRGHETYFNAEPDYPSARNAIQNALTRSALHRRWWLNDPDCLLLRSDTLLTPDEVHSLATVIVLSGGMLFLSDDLSSLSLERLRLARTLLPPIGERPWVLDWFDAATPRRLRLDLSNATGDWCLLALFNWSDEPQDAVLRLNDYDLPSTVGYFAREFWRGEAYHLTTGRLEWKALPPHSVVLLSVRRLVPGKPQYMGGNLHISQGLEVSQWQPQPDGLHLRLERPGSVQGQIELYLPRPPRSARLSGQPLTWEAGSLNCYRFPVIFTASADLIIEY